MIHNITGTITSWLSSRRFYYGVLIFFVCEAVWIACSARYPMAFDEDFHLGIIKIYSHHWLPFLSGQPSDANQFGALARDPSYLYHYLMSFPYRMLAAVTDNQMVQVVVLRLLNVPMVALALVLFRRVLRRAGMSAAFSNTALAVFVLIPILPLLAGQINYDNLLLPLVAWMCLLAFEIYTALRRRQVDVRRLGILLVVCLAASLIKYAFLPMAAATAIFLLVGLAQSFHGRRALAVKLPAATAIGWRVMPCRLRWLLVVLAVVFAGLFVQRYGVNMVRYHTPIPECDAVLDETACRAYGPWLRNYEFAAAKDSTDPVHASPVAYTWHWLQALHYRLFFMVNGPFDEYRNYPPVPLPSATAVLIAVSGLVAVIMFGRRAFASQPLLLYLGGMALFYAVVLWTEDYSQFVETGQPVAINGRYLLPVLLPLAAVLGRALHVVLSRTPRFKVWAAAGVLVLFLQGGGIFSFMLRSDDAWYWPQAAAQGANHAAQRVVAPFIVPGSKYF